MAYPSPQTEIFDITSWQLDPEYGHFPQGSRPKRALICPTPAPSPLLRAGHRYLFKESEPRYPAQYWAEIISYRIGLATDVKVPPAFAAFDSRRQIGGALIEWFYGYKHHRYRRVTVLAVEYFKRIFPDFDLKRGRHHNIKTAITVMRSIQRGIGGPSVVHYWAKLLAFDSLIGNTDRHQENWGLLWIVKPQTISFSFAPAFDNGTSLGHELTEEALPLLTDQERLDRYIGKGRHHIRWDMETDRQPQFDLLARYYRTHIESRGPIGRIAKTPLGPIIAEIDAVAALRHGTVLTDNRLQAIARMVTRRHEFLQALVQGNVP